MVHFRLEFMLTMLIYGENQIYCSAKYSFVFASKEIGLEVNADQTVSLCLEIRILEKITIQS